MRQLSLQRGFRMSDNRPKFVALYAGRTICSAKIIAATADPALVRRVADSLTAAERSLDLGTPTSTLHLPKNLRKEAQAS